MLSKSLNSHDEKELGGRVALKDLEFLFKKRRRHESYHTKKKRDDIYNKD
jgi:hypothetical protein